ncbi:MAG: hypothetical protein PHV24_05335 [Candidatus Kapabacteria bacterium]|nr:hypothetical protein [Candidatus Kapabacteria bacterium]
MNSAEKIMKIIGRRSKAALLSLVSMACIALSACNDLPTELAYPFLYDTVSVQAVSSLEYPFITGQRIVQFNEGILNSGGILVGNYNGMHSAGFIRCGDLPDSLSYITPDRIISSKFTLKTHRYALGDSLAAFPFKMYKVKKMWHVTATYDSLFTSPADYIDYSKAVASFNDVIPLTTETGDVTVDFDKELAAEWLKYGSDTTKYINLGIAIVADQNCNQIRKFAGQYVTQSDDDTIKYNNLQVIYLNKNNERDTITLNSAMDFTVSKAPRPSDDEFVLQGAAQYAMELDFDLSSLPEDIAIHSAALILTLDIDKSTISNFSDSLRDPQISCMYRVHGADSAVAGDTILPIMYGTRLDDRITYQYNLFTYAAEYLVRYMAERKGSLIFTKMPTVYQYLTLDRYVFHGLNDPDPALRPRLKIIYSKRPSYSKDAKNRKGDE